MHASRNRQPSALLGVIFFSALLSVSAVEAPSAPAVEELQRLRSKFSALLLQKAEPGEWREIEKAFQELATKYPRDAAVRAGFGEFLWERGERDGAMREWKVAEELDPRNAAVLYRLGDAHLAAGSGKSAARYFQKACAAAPTVAQFRYAAGNTTFLFRHELVDASQTEDQVLAVALAHFATAVRLAPLDGEYARAYAETFYGMKMPDWTEAIEAWRHVLEIGPNKDFACANLARVNLKAGQYGASLAWLEKIQSADYERLKSTLRTQIEAALKAKGEP